MADGGRSRNGGGVPFKAEIVAEIISSQLGVVLVSTMQISVHLTSIVVIIK